MPKRSSAVHTQQDRQDSFERFSRNLDGPMLVLTVLVIPLVAVPLIWHLPPNAARTVEILDYFVWAAFAFEYVGKLYLAPDRRQFVKRNIPDLIIVLVPLLRPLRLLRSVRLLRLLRLTRLVALVVESLVEVRAILKHRGLNYVLLIVSAVVLLCASVVLEFEKANPSANIKNYPDALWWAVTTITTVGYGDKFPMTPAGRGVAVFLMVMGIALFGVLTASIATYFVAKDADQEVGTVEEKLDQVLRRLLEIEARFGATTAAALPSDSGGQDAHSTAE